MAESSDWSIHCLLRLAQALRLSHHHPPENLSLGLSVGQAFALTPLYHGSSPAQLACGSGCKTSALEKSNDVCTGVPPSSLLTCAEARLQLLPDKYMQSVRSVVCPCVCVHAQMPQVDLGWWIAGARHGWKDTLCSQRGLGADIACEAGNQEGLERSSQRPSLKTPWARYRCRRKGVCVCVLWGQMC